MKGFQFLLILLYLSIISVSALGQGITLEKKNAHIGTLFNEIQKQAGYNFFYNDDWLSLANKVTISVKNASIEEVLDICFRSQPLVYTIDGKTISVNLRKKPDSAFNKSLLTELKGIVKNKEGELLDGVTVMVKNKLMATATNSIGAFHFQEFPSNAILIISGANLETKEVKVGAGVTNLVIVVSPKIQVIEEVIVSTGYQEIPKERATGSFTKISNELFNRVVSVNIMDRLEGVSNGVLFDKRTGQLNIQLRGLFTLTQSISQPLIVLDNFPYEGNINNINPNDVESVTMLKDAAATSIWGAKAGNGVIVITTKKGQYNQPLQVSFNSNIIFNKAPNLFDIPNLSPSDYVDAEKQLFDLGAYEGDIMFPIIPLSPVVEVLLKQRNDVLNEVETLKQLNLFRQGDIRNDYQKYLYRNGVNQQYSLNMSGGREKVKYFFSAGYDRGTDTRVGNGVSRITLKLDNTWKPVENLQIRTGLEYTQRATQYNNPLGYSDQVISNNDGTRRKQPLYSKLIDEKGAFLSVMYDYREAFTDTLYGGKLLDWKYRPLQELANTNNRVKANSYIANIDMKYAFTQALSGEVKYQYQRLADFDDKLYNLETYFARDQINRFTQLNGNDVTYPIPLGTIKKYTDSYANTHSFRAQLNFSKTWTAGHQVTALGGFELRANNSWMNTYGQYAGDVDYDVFYRGPLDEVQSITPAESGIDKQYNRFVSWYGNASYSYKGRYLLTASTRRDASNLFGVKSNRKGVPLWSVGTGWKISNESFYQSILLPYLNFRMTYGFSGNVNNSLSALTIISRFRQDVPPMQLAGISSFPNPRLRWEKVGMFNMGFDFAGKNKRIQGSIEYFNKKSVDVVATEVLDPTVGIISLKTNSARIKGQGVDFQINTLNINHSQFKWSSSFIYNHVKYRVSRYGFQGKTTYINNGLNIVPLEGYTPYLLVSTKWAGLDATGDPQGFLNGAKSKKYSEMNNASLLSDYHIHGAALPSDFGNLLNMFTWKNISLSTNITYKLNYFFRKQSVNYTKLFVQLSGHPEYLQRWQEPRDELHTNVPALKYPIELSRDYFYNNSELHVVKGDHVRLNDIRVSYDINGLMWKKKADIRTQLFLYVTDMNILLWKANNDGIDPDFPFGVRPSLVVATGFKIDF